MANKKRENMTLVLREAMDKLPGFDTMPSYVQANEQRVKLEARRPQLVAELNAAQADEDAALKVLDEAEFAASAGRVPVKSVDAAQTAFQKARAKRAALFYELQDLDKELAAVDMVAIERRAKLEALRLLTASYLDSVKRMIAAMDALVKVNAEVAALSERINEHTPFDFLINEPEKHASEAAFEAHKARYYMHRELRTNFQAPDMRLPELLPQMVGKDPHTNKESVRGPMSRGAIWSMSADDAVTLLQERLKSLDAALAA